MVVTTRIGQFAGLFLAALTVSLGAVSAEDLATELGRNEVRIYAAPHRVVIGDGVAATGLAQRLERIGYRRVHGRPERRGEFFWGHEIFWIYHDRLVGLELDRSSARILRFVDADGGPESRREIVLAPELLAESLSFDRAARQPVRFEELPEPVWQCLLAAEDARFFEHRGLDARALARATLRNLKAGRVVQGGSTITQQLVKIRDMSPRRSMTRKMSEAARALALEAEYDKQEILEAYLNRVYYGHVDGVAVYGVGTAARAFFGKSVGQLDLGEAAVLAALVQGPNRLSPVRHPDRLLVRQRWVLDRMDELGWAASTAVRSEKERGLPAIKGEWPTVAVLRHLLGWLRDEARRVAPKRLERSRGFVVETTIDPLLQERTADAIRSRLEALRVAKPALRNAPLSAAVVVLDGRRGHVLAYVGGDPAARGDDFDRARLARRQPGSAVKPLVLLEAFEDCGERGALYPARRVSDRPVRVDLASGPWEPANPDREHREALSIREALVQSLNVPFVRVGRWCGWGPTAGRMRRAGLALPDPAPPAFVLGAIETTPLELAAAYTVFADLGRRHEATAVRAIRRPSGRRLSGARSRGRRVTGPAAAFLVRDMLSDAIERGTARNGKLDGVDAYGKTGTSSDARDAWFVGGAGSLVAAVWVGMDDGTPLGLSGSSAAAPIWRDVMQAAVELTAGDAARPIEPPSGVVARWVQDATGLVVDGPRRGATEELFRRGSEPPRRRLLVRDRALPALE